MKTHTGQPGSSQSELAEGIHSLPCVTRCHYDKQINGGEIGEKGKQNGSCVVERGRTEDAKVVRNRLMRVDHACIHGSPTPSICEPYFVTHIATKGHKDALRSELPPVAISVFRDHATTRAMLI